MKQRKGENKICISCSKEFYVPNYRLKTARFCSVDCQNHRQWNRNLHTCKNCKCEFTSSPSRKEIKKYCSRDCYAEYVRKYKTTNALRRAQKVLVNNKRGINWSTNNRKHVFALKEKKCEACGYNEYDFCLDIHHADGNPNNNNIENLKVICVICHRKHHKGVIQI